MRPRLHPRRDRVVDALVRGSPIEYIPENLIVLVRALAVETHENWLEQHRYLNMDDLSEHKEALRRAP